MENEPLLFSSTSSPTSPTATSSPFSLRKHLLSSPLCTLPEHQAVSIPPDPTTTTTTIASPSSSFKDRLIFGYGDDSPPPPSSLPPVAVDPTWLAKHHPLHRSRTAPAMAAIHFAAATDASNDPSPHSASVVRYAFLLLSFYLALGIAIYSLFTSHFSASETHPIVDALYFCIVTMCTIGYGDITPVTPFAKLFAVTFVLFGFGFIDILLSSMVSYVLDLQESLLLSSINTPHSAAARNNHNYLVDYKKGRMRIRMKVALALAVVFLCIGIGTAVLRFVERMGWLDSFYLSVMSVTTVGYGDRAFKTMTGRLFASIWLLVSTLAVARAFLYLAEARIDKRHRKIAKWVLARDMTVSEFLAADIDNNGFVRLVIVYLQFLALGHHLLRLNLTRT